MPLVSIKEELEKARAGGYALPLFDTLDSCSAQGIIAALEEKKAPGIVALWSELVERPDTRAFVSYLRCLAQDSPVPVSLMLDHGASAAQCLTCLELGFTDVMLDASKLPLDENIAQTKLVVEAAHAEGAAVEAELGHVGQGVDYADDDKVSASFTRPDEVERFVTKSGVDFLAVAIGTAHGNYKGEPKLDLELLAEIRKRTEIPLVLHGGSGLSDEQFKAAIKAGISKINVFTDLGENACAEAKQVLEGDPSFLNLNESVRETFRARCGYYIELFGAKLGHSKTIIWNGPVGVFEFSKFQKGTHAIAKVLAGLKATTVIGGGSTAEAIEGMGLSHKMTHVSTGGGASLKLLEGKSLPGIDALLDK